MAWWKIEITGKEKLTDEDRHHIAEDVIEGFSEGELLDDAE